MPYELLALTTSLQVLYELLAVVFLEESIEIIKQPPAGYKKYIPPNKIVNWNHWLGIETSYLREQQDL